MSTQSPPAPADHGLLRQGSQGKGDAIFKGMATAAGITILVALAAVFVFLLIKGAPGITAPAKTGTVQNFGGKANFWDLAGPLVFGTVLFAVIALIIAVPFAIAVALFITYYAPARLATPVAYVIDLLAAVPSIVYGLWGGTALAAAVFPAWHWLVTHASWFPLFKGPYAAGGGRVGLTATLVLAVMVLPIIVAISREVFKQTPTLVQEAAIGLGATRWEMIRLSVLPHARSGIVAGVMLGLGRALGETMAVLLVSSALNPNLTLDLVGPTEPQTIASFIAGHWAEAQDEGKSVLIAVGLILFALTFAVNFLARWVIARGERKFA